MNFEYYVEFENGKGVEVVGNANTIQECFDIIDALIKEMHFNSPYKRVTLQGYKLWIDFGSWSKFFNIKRHDGKDINGDYYEFSQK